MGKILGIFWNLLEKFFEIQENFFEIFTTVYKAGLSTVRDLYDLVTKYVTKYTVLATLKILKITKKISNFLKKILRSEVTKNFFQLCSNLLYIL